MDRDSVEIMRILEDADDLSDALFQAAEWAYRENKGMSEAEIFIKKTKQEWTEIHGE